MASSEKKLVSFPLSMWSVVIAFMADWLLFAVNLLSDLRALPTALLTGGALAGLATAAVEHFELAAGGTERQDAAALEQLEVTAADSRNGRFELRIHHRSPALQMPVIIANLPVEIQ